MVEWKNIDDISTNVFAGGTPNTKYEEYYDGDIPWIRSGEIDFNVILSAERNISKLGFDNSSAKLIRPQSVVMAMTGATVAKTAVVEIATTANQSVCAIETDESKVNYKYLYYWLANNYLKIKSSAQGALTSLNLSKIKQIELPVPHLDVQYHIAVILDTFTSSIENLKEQIALRRKQYEYYRDQLLDLEGKEGVEMKTIQEICTHICSGGTPSTSHKEYYEGVIPWLRTQEIDWKDIFDTEIKITEEAIANSSAKIIPANCIIVAMYGATAAKVAINKIPLSTNQACCNLEIDSDQALYKFVYYWLCKEYLNLKSMGEGSQNNINGKKVKDYPIPVPPISEQQRIVGILDVFEESIQNLEAQLAGREKQYEYYRNKLLTFE